MDSLTPLLTWNISGRDITPNKTIIYVIFDKKKDLTDFLDKYDPNPNIEFGIALNGWIIYIDKWDCSIFFHNNKMIIGEIKINSKATLYKMSE